MSNDLDYTWTGPKEVFDAMVASYNGEKRRITMKKKDLYSRLVYFFENDKTSWGKVELVQKIKDIYIEYLEDVADGETQGR